MRGLLCLEVVCSSNLCGTQRCCAGTQVMMTAPVVHVQVHWCRCSHLATARHSRPASSSMTRVLCKPRGSPGGTECLGQLPVSITAVVKRVSQASHAVYG